MTSEMMLRRTRTEDIGRAVAEACVSAAVYFVVIGGLLWQVGRAAGYLG
jgi:hypothetical protein